MDFFIIGAQKAASSALQNMLSRDRRVSLVPGEIGLFEDPEFEPDLVQRRLKRWRLAAGKKMLGGKRPNILINPEALERLVQASPKVRLLVILRDPVQRAFSALLHSYRFGGQPIGDPNAELQQWLLNYPRLPRRTYNLMEHGLYGKHLRRIRETYPETPLLVIRGESLRKCPAEVARAVGEFLELPDLILSTGDRKNVGAKQTRRLRYFRAITRLTYAGPDAYDRLHARRPQAVFKNLHRGLAMLDNRIFSRVITGQGFEFLPETQAALRRFYAEDQKALDQFLASGECRSV